MSPAWLGTETTLKRALSLINEGYLNDHSLVELADRLGLRGKYNTFLENYFSGKQSRWEQDNVKKGGNQQCKHGRYLYLFPCNNSALNCVSVLFA